jgi:paired amphipathic helix protein Sin3a
MCKALQRRCIEKLYNDDPELSDVLESQITSAALSILLSRLNQSVENLLEARLRLGKILPPVIADNYYRSLDHHGPSFKQSDAKRMSHKGSFSSQSIRKNSFISISRFIVLSRFRTCSLAALLAEAKNMKKSRLNAADEYANASIHKDIHRIISSVHTSGEKLMMTWTKIVHPVLSANYLQSYLEETVASSEACEHCGISKDFLSSIPDALAANELSLSPKVYMHI